MDQSDEKPTARTESPTTAEINIDDVPTITGDDPELDDLGDPLGDTVDEPIVGLAIAPLARSSAGPARAAKPTDGGLNRYTLMTFFKNVSPTIHCGALDPETSITKNAPIHVDCEIGCSWKSAGLIVQFRPPPKDIDTETLVAQGYK